MIEIPLTPEEFETRARRLAAQQGIEITLPSGVIEKMGVKASYLYEQGVLTVKVLEKPFFLSDEMVEKQIRAWI